jgi:hypothetical protein
MIASALHIATEAPPVATDIKRALLSFDRVYLLDPGDRDVIAGHLYMPVVMGMPVGMNRGPIKPLGKHRSYDSAFEALIEELRPAVDQGSVVVLGNTTVPSDRFFIGSPPLPEGAPDPFLVFRSYRAMSTHGEFVGAVCDGSGLERVGSELADLVPNGAEDGTINGVPVPFARYSQAQREEDNAFLSKLSVARLGMIAKCLGICHTRALEPLASTRGPASVIRLLQQRSHLAIQSVAEELHPLLGRVARLHGLVVEKYLDVAAVDAMPVDTLLKLRDRAWGVAGESREAFGSELLRIAQENPAPDAFERACREAIDDYLTKVSDWRHQLAKLGVRVAATVGTADALRNVDVLRELLAVPTIALVLLLGAGVLTLARETGPEVMDLVRSAAEKKRLPGYTVTGAYGGLLRRS